MTIGFNPVEIIHHNILIESGTYYGDFIDSMKDRYSEIHTIEIIDELYNICTEKFKDFPHITCHHGNSPIVLREILDSISEPATFWLDAHYQDFDQPDETRRPLIQELNAIASHHINTHMIMIDDVRLFGVYRTTTDEVEGILRSINPEYTIEYRKGYVQNDTLVAYIK